MRERILIALLSILLIWCAGNMTFALYLVYSQGAVFIEPNTAVLIAELVVYALFTMIGLVSFCLMLWDFLRCLKEVKGDHR